MGFRFRKSVSLFPGVRLNIGKSGLGVSAGVKGARVGVGSKGAYTSVGISGTGISSVNYLGKGKKQNKAISAAQKPKGNALLGLLFLTAIVLTFIYPLVGIFSLLAVLVVGYLRNRKSQQNAAASKTTTTA